MMKISSSTTADEVKLKPSQADWIKVMTTIWLAAAGAASGRQSVSIRRRRWEDVWLIKLNCPFKVNFNSSIHYSAHISHPNISSTRKWCFLSGSFFSRGKPDKQKNGRHFSPPPPSFKNRECSTMSESQWRQKMAKENNERQKSN